MTLLFTDNVYFSHVMTDKYYKETKKKYNTGEKRCSVKNNVMSHVLVTI
jgi:hypothetical protein